jgi:SAM-dependent methyltransferase
VGNIEGKDVLCLASGGGQQSSAWAILGANVTVVDLSETQLERDSEAAAHYGLSIGIVQGDMRDLLHFENDSFDIVFHPYSINFVPDVRPVFREVARVVRTKGLYHLQFHNPFVAGLDETGWNGTGYNLRLPYLDGGQLFIDDPYWDVEGIDGVSRRVEGPKEFRHTLGTVLSSLADEGFSLLKLREQTADEPDAEPGTWEHFKSVAPPYLYSWFSYRPDVLG